MRKFRHRKKWIRTALWYSFVFVLGGVVGFFIHTYFSFKPQCFVEHYLSSAAQCRGYRPNTKNLRRIITVVETGWSLFNLSEISKDWIYAILFVENPTFDSQLIGPKGEIGISQLMPDSIVYARKKLQMPFLDPFSVEDNVIMMLAILEQKLKTHKDVKKAIIAYNGYIVDRGTVRDQYYIKVERAYRDILKHKKVMQLRQVKKIL